MSPLTQGSKKSNPASGAAVLPPPARRHRLVAQVGRALRRQCGVIGEAAPAPVKLVVGVSGGADSLALLIATTVLRDRRRQFGRVSPVVVHVNHHLLADADRDAERVAAVCRGLSVKCRVVDIEPAGESGNLYNAARRLRYEALASAAREEDAGAVAVGHHADDQLETMLMALCRGAGPEGLSAMAWSRPLEEGVQLVRPLLRARRAACEELCRAAGIEWVDDPANAALDRTRARLRSVVMPELESLWPDAARRAAGTAEMIGLCAQVMSAEVERVFGPRESVRWERDDLRSQPLPILAAGLRRAALEQFRPSGSLPGGDGAPGLDQLGQRQLLQAAEAVADSTRRPRSYHWPRGLQLRITARIVELIVVPPPSSITPKSIRHDQDDQDDESSEDSRT